MTRHDDSVVMIGRDRTSDVEPANDVDAHSSDEREATWRRILSLTFTIAVVVFTIYFWPAMLGGSARLVIVSGHSMEPTYDLQDIVVTRDAGDTQVGDIVLFEVPEGEAEGMLIIHRVLEVDDEGFFITQGDNRDTPDQWQLTEDNIVGKPLARIPQGGKALAFIQNIWVIAFFVGLVVLFVLWPDQEEDAEEAEDTDDIDAKPLVSAQALAVATIGAPETVIVASGPAFDKTDAFERDAAWALVDAPTVLEPASNGSATAPTAKAMPTVRELVNCWPDRTLEQPIDDDVMADAIAWLDEQLDSFNQPAAR